MSATFNLSQLADLNIATAKVPHVHSASLGIFLPVGSRHETTAPNGICHFLEHMIFKGTDTRSARDIATEAEGAGITMNAYTTEDHTLLEMRGILSTLPQMVELSADMLWNSRFDPHDIENEARVIEEEIIGYEESPAEHVHDLLSKAIWPNDPLGAPITGSVDSIAPIDRSQLQAFHHQHYRKKGTCVAVAGDVEHSEINDCIQNYFPNSISPNESKIKPPTQHSIDIIEHRDIEQAHLAIGYKTKGRHSTDRHALRMISLMLGETMSSLLFQKIREELGLCYSIQSDFSLFDDVGSFTISAALDGDRYQQAKDTIDSILNTFVRTGPTATMLENAKRYALIQNKLGLEGTQPYMHWIGDSVACYDRIILPDEAETTIQSITMDDIMRVTEATFTNTNKASAAILPEELTNC